VLDPRDDDIGCAQEAQAVLRARGWLRRRTQPVRFINSLHGMFAVELRERAGLGSTGPCPPRARRQRLLGVLASEPKERLEVVGHDLVDSRGFGLSSSIDEGLAIGARRGRTGAHRRAQGRKPCQLRSAGFRLRSRTPAVATATLGWRAAAERTLRSHRRVARIQAFRARSAESMTSGALEPAAEAYVPLWFCPCSCPCPTRGPRDPTNRRVAGP